MKTEQERTEFYALVADIRNVLKRTEETLNEMVMAFEGEGFIGTKHGAFYKMPLRNKKSMFVGKKPVSVLFWDGREINVKTWSDVVLVIMQDCISNEELKAKVFDLREKVAGRFRTVLDSRTKFMARPLEITEGLYFETRMNTEIMLEMLTERVLDEVGYDYSEIYIVYR